MHIVPIYAFIRTAKIKQLNIMIMKTFDGDADLDYSSVRNDEEDEVDDDEDEALQDAFLV